MKILNKSFITFKFMLILTIFIPIYCEYKNQLSLMIPLFALCLFLFINESIRLLKLKNNYKWNHLSLFITIGITLFLHLLAGHINTITLLYILLYDIFNVEKRILKPLIAFHSTTYFTSIIYAFTHVSIK